MKKFLSATLVGEFSDSEKLAKAIGACKNYWQVWVMQHQGRRKDMRRLFVLALICFTTAVCAQEIPPVLKGRVFAPDGTPVRNSEGKLNMWISLLPREGSFPFSTTVKTNSEGVFEVRQRENLEFLERESLRSFERHRGKRALAWVYLFVPEVGAVMTRRFFWTVGEPLPDLHLKPLARLKVEFVCPVLNIPLTRDKRVARADDPGVLWDAEWVPANEWLKVAEMTLKLQPGEERRLIVPTMPSSAILAYLEVVKPYSGRFEPFKEPLPPLPVGGNLLRGDYGFWGGWMIVSREEPFQFIFVPPVHFLRIPVERLEMKPLVDTVPSLSNYSLHPTPITEVECEIAEGTEAKLIEWDAHLLNPRVRKRLENVVRDALFPAGIPQSLKESLLGLIPQSVREGLFNWFTERHLAGGWERLGYKRTCKLWVVTKWTPAVVRAILKVSGRVHVIAFPIRGREGAMRQRFKIELRPPKYEPTKVARLRTGRLEGIVQTLDGKPITDVTVAADFVESKLVVRLSEEEEEPCFYTTTDEQGRFVFPKLPEGKYDLGLVSLQWVSCAEAVVKANKTTKVKMVALEWLKEQQFVKQRVTVQFQFPDGTPVAGYEFFVSPSGEVSPYEGQTDEQGCISLEAKCKWLDIFLRSGYQDLLGTFSLKVPSDQSKIVVTVPTPLRGMVEGKVTLPNGSANDRVIVTVWKLERNRWDDAYPRSVYQLRVLPDGRFFCTLPEGAYVFKAEPMPSEYQSIDFAPSFSPPVIVKAGEVTKVEWQLKPVTQCNFEFAFPQFEWQPPTIATLHIRTEHYDGQVYESKFDLPMVLFNPTILEPLAKLDENEKTLWDDSIAPGFYRLTSWGWLGEEFNAVARISRETDRLTLTPPSAFPTLTITGRVLLPNNEPASNAIVALYDPDQKMKRWATVCDDKGQFTLSVQLPNKGILERQHFDTLLPNSSNELWLIAWKIGYGHSLIQRLPRPSRKHGTLTVDVGALVLSRSERVEGQIVDEDGNPVHFVGVVMLPVDTNMFAPKPDMETLMRELTAFEDFDVGSIPHAQADINGRFCVEGLRQGRYLLVSRARFYEDGQVKAKVAYQFVNVPSGKITVRLERPKGTLTATPYDLTNALSFAEAEIWIPHLRLKLRADEFGKFEANEVLSFEGVPILVRIMHRDGIVAEFNPPRDWRYVVQMRP